MGSGKGDGFPKDQKAWLNDLKEAYLNKTLLRKPVIPGQPPLADDSDLKQWVDQRQREFEAKFCDDLTASVNEGATTEAKIHAVSLDSSFTSYKVKSTPFRVSQPTFAT